MPSLPSTKSSCGSPPLLPPCLPAFLPTSADSPVTLRCLTFCYAHPRYQLLEIDPAVFQESVDIVDMTMDDDDGPPGGAGGAVGTAVNGTRASARSTIDTASAASASAGAAVGINGTAGSGGAGESGNAPMDLEASPPPDPTPAEMYVQQLEGQLRNIRVARSEAQIAARNHQKAVDVESCRCCPVPLDIESYDLLHNCHLCSNRHDSDALVVQPR